jgi:hypothetical protein
MGRPGKELQVPIGLGKELGKVKNFHVFIPFRRAQGLIQPPLQ